MILKADSYFETFRSDSSCVLDKLSLCIVVHTEFKRRVLGVTLILDSGII